MEEKDYIKGAYISLVENSPLSSLPLVVQSVLEEF